MCAKKMNDHSLLLAFLTGRAWECCLEVDRNQLKTPTGVEFLLEHLRAKRGNQQVDLLGDALQSTSN